MRVESKGLVVFWVNPKGPTADEQSLAVGLRAEGHVVNYHNAALYGEDNDVRCAKAYVSPLFQTVIKSLHDAGVDLIGTSNVTPKRTVRRKKPVIRKKPVEVNT